MPEENTPDEDFNVDEEENKELLKAQEQARQARILELEDIKFIMSTDQGTRTMARMMTIGGVYSSSFRSDDSAVEFREGMRNLALVFLGDIAIAAPEKLPHLMPRIRRGQDG